MINGLVAHVELEHEIMKLTSLITNSLVFIYTNGVALREMAQGNAG